MLAKRSVPVLLQYSIEPAMWFLSNAKSRAMFVVVVFSHRKLGLGRVEMVP